MEVLIDSFVTALKLIFTGNREIFSIASRTLAISLTSTLIAASLCIPLAGLIHFHQFPGKGMLVNTIQTLFSLPTVFVGVLVFITFSRAGPLGSLGILFTPKAIVVGHVLLISPIVTGLTISALGGVSREIKDTVISLGANRVQTIFSLVKEARAGVITAVLVGYGRAISEIGLAIIVGGNIRGQTRTLTTAMSLEISIGNFEVALALGMILVSLALAINILVNHFRQR